MDRNSSRKRVTRNVRQACQRSDKLAYRGIKVVKDWKRGEERWATVKTQEDSW